MTIPRIKEILISLLVFLLVYTVYLNSGNPVPLDSMWTIPVSMSMIKQGNTDLDEYRPLIDRTDEGTYLIQIVGKHLYANYPPSISLLAAPFVLAAEQFARQAYSIDLATYVQNNIPWTLELLIASFFTALTAVLIYRIARLYLNVGLSLVLTFIFAFCTTAWSVASRALWRHGPSMLMLTIALYLILLAKKKPWLIQFVSLPLALSFTIRGHNGLSLAFITLFVLIQYRSYFLRYILWAMPVAVPFVAYNLSIYQAPASPYYSGYQPSISSSFFEGALGNLISPSRGLLIFSPVLILAILGVALKLKRRTFDQLDGVLISVIILHWLVISDWGVWWGGTAFGPRFFTDILPYWIYLMIPAMAALSTLSGRRKLALVSITAVLAGFSFFVHYRGVSANEVMNEWHTWPISLGDRPTRVWDWSDIQFLRGLKWGPPVVLGNSGVPVRQYDLATYTLLGTNDIRTHKFNANASLLAPTGQAWLAIADSQPVGSELSALFQDITPQAELRTIGSKVPYRLYHFDLGARLSQAAQQAEQRAWYSSDLYPDPVQAQAIDLPVRFGSVVDLIGFQVITDAQSSAVTTTTYWRAAGPAMTPLRLFVHAINADGQIVAQGDRLDTSTKDWQPGDLIVQVNRLSFPPDAGRVWIEIGLYNPDSGERQPVLMNDQEIDQRLLITSIGFK